MSGFSLRDIENLNLACLVNQLNGVERTFGDYLFYKYIKPNINLDGLNEKEKYDKIKDEKEKFNKEYFLTKPQTISQEQQIINEINDIKQANKIYETDEKYSNKIIKTVYGYPDRYRCEYIMVKNHKLTRCKCKVLKDKEIDTDMTASINEINDDLHLYKCSKHINSDNKYSNEYYELVKKVEKTL